MLELRLNANACWTNLIDYQVLLLGMIFIVQSSQGDGSTPFDIPFSVSWSVRLGQIIAVLVTITLSRDIFLPIKELSTLWFSYEQEWLKVTGPLKEKRAFPVWIVRILFPNILQVSDWEYIAFATHFYNYS